MMQEIIDNLLLMLLFLFFSLLIYVFGLKKSFKNNGALFYEKALILFVTSIIASFTAFIKMIFIIMDM
jgi:hypothetical protein